MTIKIVCLGDSITGWHRSWQDGTIRNIPVYPTQLQQMLGEEYEIINAGIDGAISGEALDGMTFDRG